MALINERFIQETWLDTVYNLTLQTTLGIYPVKAKMNVYYETQANIFTWD